MEEIFMSEMLTLNEVSMLVHKADIPISRDTLRNLSDKGFLPCTRTERGLRLFNRSDVENFIDERKQKKNAITKQTELAA